MVNFGFSDQIARRRVLNEGGEKFRIVMGGYLQNWINDEALQVLEDLVARPNIHLDLIVGSHWGSRTKDDRLERLIGRLEAKDNAVLRGVMLFEDFCHVLGHGDVWLDFFSRTLEREYAMVSRTNVALSLGVPVIHPNFTTDSGWLFDPSRPEELMSLIDELARNRSNIAERGQAASVMKEKFLDPIRSLARLAKEIRAWSS